MQKQCEYINEETGEQCQGFALESGLCFSHDPERAEEKKAAVLKGGQTLKKVNLNLPPVSIKTVEDVVSVLEETINLVRSGDIPCSNVANTIGFLAGHMLKALEVSDVEQRVEMIESVMFERKMAMRASKRR